MNKYLTGILSIFSILIISAVSTQASNDANYLPGKLIIQFKKSSSFVPSDFSKLKILGLKSPQQLLKDKQSIGKTLSKMNSAKLKFGNHRIEKIIEAEKPLLRTYIVDIDPSIDPAKLANQLMKKNPEIAWAEPYYLPKIQALTNDPLASTQQTLKLINFFEAIEIYEGDSSIVIGISDNGVYQDHEDLKDNIAINRNEIPDNGIDDDENGYIDDYKGYNFSAEEEGVDWDDTYHYVSHGSNVAGIAAADYNNLLGMTGTGGKSRFFPIKTMEEDVSDDMKYGYESIIYAAIRGFKVLNCSWGSEKPFSPIDQDIIDFAVARDVAIIASAGNSGDIIPYYPAGYFGVLGVGETNVDDKVDFSSALGWHVRILAPGEGNISTANGGSYTAFGGTSSAAPIVSGAMALVRGRYPELSALQAIEFLRQMTVDIRDKNPFEKEIIPGRIDIKKALTTDPMSIPGIALLNYNLSNANGDIFDRFSKDETVYLNLDLKNYLGKSEKLTLKLRIVDDDNNTAQPVDSTVEIDPIGTFEEIELNSLSFKINEYNPDIVFIRIDIEDKFGYKDFFLIPLQTGKEMSTFENDKIAFSAGDRGVIGFIREGSNIVEGIGFRYGDQKNDLFEAGFMAAANNSKLVSGVNGSGPNLNDFAAVEGFLYPNPNTAVFEDSRAKTEMMIQILAKEEIILEYGSSLVRMDIETTNLSGESLVDFALGYYFDWDLTRDESNNRVRYFEEGLPGTGFAEAAEIIEVPDSVYPVYGTAVFSTDEDAQPQAAGLNFNITKNFSEQLQIQSLTSGTSWQDETIQDVNYVVGIKFGGITLPGESRSFTMIFGAADNADQMAEKMKMALLNISSVNRTNLQKDFRISVNPSIGGLKRKLILNNDSFAGISRVFIYDYAGRSVESFTVTNRHGRNVIDLDLIGFSPGAYFVRAVGGKSSATTQFIISE